MQCLAVERSGSREGVDGVRRSTQLNVLVPVPVESDVLDVCWFNNDVGWQLGTRCPFNTR